MKYEIRDGRLHLSGYVNAVERDSKELHDEDGAFVEQIQAGVFAKALVKNPNVRMKFNHKREVDADLTLREDNIGLYAEADTDDEEIMALAGKGALRGWSFGFYPLDVEVEERKGKSPRRIVRDLDLTEVSVLSIAPAYNGTSVKYRSEDMSNISDESETETEGEGTGTETEPTGTEPEAVEEPAEVVTVDEETVTEEAVDPAQGAVMAYKLEKLKNFFLKNKLNLRYNHYHNPVNGQFASGKGGGEGLYYSMGKKKGEIVGAKSK